MTSEKNSLGQPIGHAVPNWKTSPRPARVTLAGRFCRVEPLDPARHAADLFAANSTDKEGRMWTYLGYGPFSTLEEYRAWMEPMCRAEDPLFFAIVDASSGQAAGVASLLRIDPANGSIEVGHLAYSPLLQRKPAATEAMFLLMQYAFSLGYRRYEWKCNALNEPSRLAAQRLGFSYEGVFRQAAVVKGHNRDTAWYAMIDSEWPSVRDAFTRWLSPANFDSTGRQRSSLGSLTAPIVKSRQ